MTYDQWKTTDPRELLPYEEEQPTELDLVYEQLHRADATISRLTAELARAEERDSGGRAPDGKTWKQALFDEAARRGEAEAERDRLRKALEPLAFFNGRCDSAADMERLGALFADAKAALATPSTQSESAKVGE